jgi:hypothetical protein
MGTFEKFERVKAGADIGEVLAEAAEMETVESEDEAPLPTEAEIAAEEPADEAEETDEADVALEETGGEEEDEAA